MANLVVLAFAAVLLFIFCRILNLIDSPRVPKLFALKSTFINEVLLSCPILFERYGKMLTKAIAILRSKLELTTNLYLLNFNEITLIVVAS